MCRNWLLVSFYNCYSGANIEDSAITPPHEGTRCAKIYKLRIVTCFVLQWEGSIDQIKSNQVVLRHTLYIMCDLIKLDLI